MDELIIGEKIKIRPAKINDKRKVYDWLTKSTKFENETVV